jgi:hypothetical protein
MVIVLSETFSLRKVGWVFPQVWGFPNKSFCLLVLVYLLLDPAYISNIWLLNVKGRSKYSGKSIATENLRKANRNYRNKLEIIALSISISPY